MDSKQQCVSSQGKHDIITRTKNQIKNAKRRERKLVLEAHRAREAAQVANVVGNNFVGPYVPAKYHYQDQAPGIQDIKSTKTENSEATRCTNTVHAIPEQIVVRKTGSALHISKISKRK
jgi:hypothetical protein